jgi:hypothetical protein
MGGAGAWNILANRTNYFAAAGDSDEIVPVSSSRDRIAARRKAGGHPIYTEYAGVDHNGAVTYALPNLH